MVSLSWFWQSTSLASLFARSRGRFKLAHQHRADPDKETALEYKNRDKDTALEYKDLDKDTALEYKDLDKDTALKISL